MPHAGLRSLNARALVACVGNTLAGDDAAGAAVYERLSRRPPPEARLVYMGLAGIALLEHLAGEPLLIVVDAVQLGAAPGSVHVLSEAQLPEAGAAVSAHGIGLREALEAGRLLYPGAMPGRAVLVGIEGRRFDALGVRMSQAVARAVPRAARAVLRILKSGGPPKMATS